MKQTGILTFILLVLSITLCHGQQIVLDKYANKASSQSEVRIAAVSVLPDKWDKAANWQRIARLVREAASEGGAKLIVTPEGALEGYVINEVNSIENAEERAKSVQRFRELAEPLDGVYLKKAYALAKELKIFFLLGFLEKEQEHVYNTALLIDPDGDIIGRYRKTHFAQGYQVNPACYCPGDGYPIVHTPFGKVGIIICYDRQLPEPARVLAVKGAQLLLVPSYGSYGITMDWNTILLRTRAFENKMPLVFSHPFQSLLINQHGHVQAQGEANEVVYADMNMASASYEERFGNRRPAMYASLTEPAPPTVESTVDIRHGDLAITFRDNSQSPEILSGLQSLINVKAAPEFDAFDPDTKGASAGLNFEHIISGHRNSNNAFAPRQGQYELRRFPNGTSFELVRNKEDSPWSVSSRLRYDCVAPHAMDFQFQCQTHEPKLFGERGTAIFFFANYMNDVEDHALHFRGIEHEGGEETWIRADAPAAHVDHNVGGTYRHQDADPVTYDEDHNFKLNSWSYEYPRFTQPFYYGRAANGMVFMLMFDSAHSETEEIRFSLFKFKLKQFPRPAWDFQYVLRKPSANKSYGFRGRVVWKSFVSSADCLREYQAWRANLETE